MSIALMTEVRDRVFDNPTEKLVAMRLADCGNDDGAAVYPKVSTLADDCLIKERRAQNILAKFQAMKLLVLVQEARGHRQRVYRLDPDVLCSLPLTASAQARRARKEARKPSARGAVECTPKGDRGAAECTPRGAVECTPIETVQETVLSTEVETSVEGARTPFALTPPERPPAKGDAEATFERFWQAYPRKVAKGRARKAWAKATAKVDPETIIEGAARYAAEQHGRDPEFTKHPATWITGECWLDEPAPRRSGRDRQGPRSSVEAFARAAGVNPDALDRP